FMTEGVDGLLSDKTRPPGKPPVPDDRAARVVATTLQPPPHEVAHRTARAMAKAAGLSVLTVQGIWKGEENGKSIQWIDFPTNGLARHRWRHVTLSNGELANAFAETLHAIVGFDVAPPMHAVVLSLDEKSQSQALDRTQPGLPLKKGCGATTTHDYKRNGTTTLSAALNILTGEVLGRNMQRHHHREFIRFLNALERAIPAGKVVHVILDKYAAHKHEKVRAWLARHPRWTFHVTPTSSSWLNAVEGVFGKLTRRRLKHGVFRSVAELQAAINRFVAEHNDSPKPFIRRANPDAIIAARSQGLQALEAVHQIPPRVRSGRGR
ncbi:MAG: IS630 family transposase, partial [Pseudomonadota bacterium]